MTYRGAVVPLAAVVQCLLVCSQIHAFAPPSVTLSHSRCATHFASRPPVRSAAGLVISPVGRRAGLALELRMMAGERGEGNGDSLSRLVGLEGRRYVLVGGKGGVGKTSTSAAIAIKLADEGLRTLVISTDPAHSLGDALTTDLSSGRVTPISEQGGLLYGLEVDLQDSVAEFKRVVGGLSGGAEGETIADKLGLGSLTDIFDNPPPGADELVALSKVISLVEEGEAKTALGESIKFDRIVIDTAPTGHTMRLLEYPKFITNLLTKALSLRGKIDVPFDVVGQAGSFLAGQLGIDMPSKEDIQKGGTKVRVEAEKFRDRMEMFDQLLHNPDKAEFVVVSIATDLSAAETERLLPALIESEVAVRHLVVNQLLRNTGESEAYLTRLYKEQQRCLKTIKESPSLGGGLAVTEVPRFDMEVVGVFGLRALGKVAFKRDVRDVYGRLFDPTQKSQFVFVGGKGGVGKTSTSSALGIALADEGIRTLIISTDPAHSLGDALGVKLKGEPTVVDGTEGMLSAMEVDTEASMEEFKENLRGVTQWGSRFGSLASKIGLDEFADILESPPPGVDEVVALSKVMNLVKSEKFDRIIVDTAPTGHTLRLLSLPDFVDNFLNKILAIKAKIDGALNAAKSLFGLKGIVSGDEDQDDIEVAVKAVERQRDQARELESMLRDGERTQFMVVTIPTALAMLESERLVKELKDKGVAVRGAVVNQVMAEKPSAGYAGRVAKSQEGCLERLNKAADAASLSASAASGPVLVSEVPYFDTELRSVYALRALAAKLFS
uniref:ArsA/GET3 Anion-transporting ATPase-like domain-containing protein n=1 Tax=Hemiselmis tepida TaxID=464990 RepID=A0A7S0W1Q8_9CRYP|mmetsp:Transcript_31972/g.81376  ORF Transcript_31972/g.81376 Transcript_31972/m.81376 type:complete len:780 (+) Transcript_31972:119-2458(+)|eukprot:CAMPEP_0174916022 /NCGR_PEP_ID=MMETSP1355-20121228/1505_1 /TAXON_ID=464990 /ORGANISM="Hemiselmis tepida, Strain CCMP443" /LENGTH=779 /DNA_ID=CAMNT_0016160983 /DNA_START=97 /DNA_END=2436 /DNA_ORIENTATION=+